MKTTQKHLKVFQDEFLKTIDLLGVTGWEFYFTFTDEKDTYARVNTNTIDHLATAMLCKDWDELDGHYKLTDEHIRSKAIHEACHVLVARLDALANARYKTEDELNQAEHELTRRIEALVKRVK